MLFVTTMNLNGLSPKQRGAIWRDGNHQFITAVPHVIERDINAGSLVLRPTDLIVVDEAHHARKKYPFAPVVTNARERGARVLMLSATPAEYRGKERGWAELDDLKKLAGVQNIMVMNVQVPRPDAIAIPVRLTDQMLEVQSYLRHEVAEHHDIVRATLEYESRELLKLFNKLAGTRVSRFLASQRLPELYAKVGEQKKSLEEQSCSERARKLGEALSRLRSMQELSELNGTLVFEGILPLLKRIVAARAQVIFNGKNAKRYLSDVYFGSAVEQIYRVCARGDFVKINSRSALSTRLHADNVSVTTAGSKDLVQQKLVQNLLGALEHEWLTQRWSLHPKDDYLVKRLLNRHQPKTIVSTRDRDHVGYIARVLNSRLESRGVHVCTFTGSGGAVGDGMTRQERQKLLADFNHRASGVLICTSVGNEGIDFSGVERGFGLRFNASGREKLQKEGRLGRNRDSGLMTYLCSTDEEYGKFLTTLRKTVEYYRMLAHERQALFNQWKQN
jgi:ATP-dependent DNA helicase MPH1